MERWGERRSRTCGFRDTEGTTEQAQRGVACAAEAIKLGNLADGLETHHFRDVGAEVSFDAQFEGHVARGATNASPMKPDPNNTLGGQVDELHIAAVGLDRRADQAEDLLDTLTDLGSGIGLDRHYRSVRRWVGVVVERVTVGVAGAFQRGEAGDYTAAA